MQRAAGRLLAARRRATWSVCVLLAAVLLTVSGGSARADPPAATESAGVATVGPLFPAGLGSGHTCTASVIVSADHDLILTAAHCLSGDVTGWVLAPGYRSGATPYGAWEVTAAYLPQQWTASQDPQHDYAILRVAHQERGGSSVGVEDVTGSQLLLAAPTDGLNVTAVAYNAGTDDLPISCTAVLTTTDGFPTFGCDGYVGGSSGSPWLAGDVVVGLIGGLHQGGCDDDTSYSPAFTTDIYLLWLRAAAGGGGDTAPVPGSDGC